ncbi:MAG: hypothetical protein DMG07_20020 [Acidobacteria bacterium]|nr:MAG: hypothetical protein DMG07_20020 [Acidobacteriota bacterium]
MSDEPGDVVFGRDPELETEGVGRTDVWVLRHGEPGPGPPVPRRHELRNVPLPGGSLSYLPNPIRSLDNSLTDQRREVRRSRSCTGHRADRTTRPAGPRLRRLARRQPEPQCEQLRQAAGVLPRFRHRLAAHRRAAADRDAGGSRRGRGPLADRSVGCAP